MQLKIDKDKFSNGVNLDRFKADLVKANLTGVIESIDDKVTHLFINGDNALNNTVDIKTINDVVKAHDGTPDPDSARNNLSATTDPTTSDNLDAGYSKGSIWINTVLDKALMLVDAVAGLWKETTLVGNADKGYEESDGTSSTTSTSFQQKFRLTILGMAAGDYLVWYSAEINTVNGGVVHTKIEIDDTTIVGTPEYSGSNPIEFNGVSGFKKVTLSAADHDFDFDFKTKNGGETSKIRNARILVRGISV